MDKNVEIQILHIGRSFFHQIFELVRSNQNIGEDCISQNSDFSKWKKKRKESKKKTKQILILHFDYEFEFEILIFNRPAIQWNIVGFKI